MKRFAFKTYTMVQKARYGKRLAEMARGHLAMAAAQGLKGDIEPYMELSQQDEKGGVTRFESGFNLITSAQEKLIGQILAPLGKAADLTHDQRRQIRQDILDVLIGRLETPEASEEKRLALVEQQKQWEEQNATQGKPTGEKVIIGDLFISTGEKAV